MRNWTWTEPQERGKVFPQAFFNGVWFFALFVCCCVRFFLLVGFVLFPPPRHAQICKLMLIGNKSSKIH